MARRLQAAHMVRGMGMGMRILELLEKGVRETGGNPEALMFMTRPRFEENVAAICRAIKDCDWRIPASEMRFLSEQHYRKEYEVETDRLEEVRNLWWTFPMSDLGLEFSWYGGDDDPPIPDLYRSQLDGRELTYPLFLNQGGEINNKVLVGLSYRAIEPSWLPGHSIEMSKVYEIAVADSSYFDFDK